MLYFWSANNIDIFVYGKIEYDWVYKTAGGMLLSVSSF